MKNKRIFTIAIISLIICMGIAAYLWYLYFHEYEDELYNASCKPEFKREVKLVNTGNVNYTDAKAEDSDSDIPTYYFSVKNSSDKTFEYVILFEDNGGNDGCLESERLKRDELEYELKLDNKVIKAAGLETLVNNVLDTNTISGKGVKDYSLKIKLKSGVTGYEEKHFHYLIDIKEKE